VRERRSSRRNDPRAGYKLFQKSATRPAANENMQKKNRTGNKVSNQTAEIASRDTLTAHQA